MSTVEEDLRIMVADDEYSIRQSIEHHLTALGYSAESYEDGVSCLSAFRQRPADILIADLRMPNMNGIELLAEVKKLKPDTEVVIVTAHGDKQAAVEALRLGAFDFFEKPLSLAELTETIKRTVRYQSALRERDKLRDQMSLLSKQEARQWGIEAMVGTTNALRAIFKDIRRLQDAPFTCVLATGESGTGKELVARAIHFGSARSAGPFVPVNCAAIPADLAESLLFGHVKGSFTGATDNKSGCFEQAHGGTLFLDEIGDMPLMLQAKLLRVLEDGIVTPIGSRQSIKVDIRVISATNQNIHERVSDGSFRNDLYYRLARFTISIPPLRERKSDIPSLVAHFMLRFAAEMGIQCPAVSNAALDALNTHSFPGNIRELKNIIERALIESEGNDIGPQHLVFSTFTKKESCAPGLDEPRSSMPDLPLNLSQAEAALIKKAMSETGGNVSAAAKLLGIHRTRLHRKLHRLVDSYEEAITLNDLGEKTSISTNG